MKVEEVPFEDADSRFIPFRISIHVTTRDELYSLTRAAARMTNGHGLQLLDILKRKCERFDVEQP